MKVLNRRGVPDVKKLGAGIGAQYTGNEEET